MTRARRRGAWLAALLPGVLGCAASPPAAAPATLADGRYAMGTVLEITLHGADPAQLARARDRAFARVEVLESQLSTWRSESDVSRLNAAGDGSWVAVAPEAAALLRASKRLTRQTRGVFDVTVGPLVSLWREAETRGALPTEAELRAARARVGPQHLEIDAQGRARLDPGSEVELGGVAKGFALDRLRTLLAEEGVRAALLSFGQSSAWAIGAPPDAPEGWRLLARAPDGGFAGVLTLRDLALSVSGSLGQWAEIEGRRLGHVLDPRSGQPLTGRREALVVGPDATLAEALSKAVLVLGEREGLAVVREAGCEALLLDADGRSWATPGWAAATRFETLPAGGGSSSAPGSRPIEVGMGGLRDLECPVCRADLPLSGEERAGDEVFCTYCGAPGRLTAAPTSDDCEVEEDF